MSLLDKYLKILKSQKFLKCGKEGSWFFIPHFSLQPQKVLFALMVNHFVVDHVITIIKDFAHQTFNENLCFGHFGNFRVVCEISMEKWVMKMEQFGVLGW